LLIRRPRASPSHKPFWSGLIDRLRQGLCACFCDKKQKLLKRHVAVEHELTPNQYHETFDLKSDYPMAAPNCAQQRRELALSIGLGRPKKPARPPKSSQSATTEAGL
jgi:predicted transcriptional regulator